MADQPQEPSDPDRMDWTGPPPLLPEPWFPVKSREKHPAPAGEQIWQLSIREMPGPRRCFVDALVKSHPRDRGNNPVMKIRCT